MYVIRFSLLPLCPKKDFQSSVLGHWGRLGEKLANAADVHDVFRSKKDLL